MNALCLVAATYLSLASAFLAESEICKELPGRTAVVCKCDADKQVLEEPGDEHTFRDVITLSFENCASVSITPTSLAVSKKLKRLTFTNIKNLTLFLTLPRTLENVTITNTNVSELSADTFSALSEVKSFQMKDSWVVEIEPRTFSNSYFKHVEFTNVTFQNLPQDALQLEGDKVVIERCTFLSPGNGSIQIDSAETILCYNKFYNLNNRTVEVVNMSNCRPNSFSSGKRDKLRPASSKDDCNQNATKTIKENANICGKEKFCSSYYSGFHNVCQVNSSNICDFKNSSFLKTFGIKPSTCSDTQKESSICELYIISDANILSFHAVLCVFVFVLYIFKL